MPTPFTAPLDTRTLASDFYRADIELRGIDHSGSSYEGRVYVNNAAADESTGRATRAGYVGSYFIFGHGGCLGDEGHCDVKARRVHDPRRGHPLEPARKTIIATDAIRAAVAADTSMTVTIVPIIRSVGPRSGWEEDVLQLEAVRVIAYR